MRIQNFGVTDKEHYGMLWYFLEWSIDIDYLQLSVHQRVKKILPTITEYLREILHMCTKTCRLLNFN